MITIKTTLAEVVKQFPQTISYLNDLHLDYCCNGHLPIEESLKNVELDSAGFLQELNRLAAQPAPAAKEHAASIDSFAKLSVNEMLSELERTHHTVERKMMDQVEQLLNKILIVHYPHHGKELTLVHRQFAMLKAELEEHFAKEERLVFPIMRANPHPDQTTLGLIAELEQEHIGVGDLLKELQRMTEDYRLPEDACATYTQTYRLMRELTEDVFLHVFKENSIVFPEYAEQQ